MAGKSSVELALSNLGSSKPAPAPEAVIAPLKYQSRFFFQLDEELVQARKEKFAPKTLVHVDAHIDKLLGDYRPKATPAISANIDLVRSFFLKEIAPIMLAASAGTKQAYEVVEKLVDSKVDHTLSTTFDSMVMRAARIKLAQFVTNMFGLSKDLADELLAQKVDNPEKKLVSLLEDLSKMVEEQSKGINVLTNRVNSNEKLLRRKKAD